MGKRGKSTDRWRILEQQTLEAITAYGDVHTYTYSQFKSLPKSKWPKIFVVRDMPIKRTWEALGCKAKNTKTEYVLFIRPDAKTEHLKIRIECKFQQKEGTAIDKMLMAIIDLKYFSPPDETFSLIIVDGKECKKRISAISELATIQIQGWDRIVRKIPASVQVFTLRDFENFLRKVWGDTKKSS